MKSEEFAAAFLQARQWTPVRFFITLSSFFISHFIFLLAPFSFLILFSSCSEENKLAVDRLNTHSYDFHYRNIDSTEHYARQAFQLSANYDAGKAEALNNMAFVSIIRMDYARAEKQLNEVLTLTDNQVEQFVAEVQHMRLCQRRSNNRAFYEHRERALTHMKRINEERESLPQRMQRRMTYATTEMAIVNSTYYYYVGLEQQSSAALHDVNTDEVRRDTAQYLNYLYNIGAGGILTTGTPEQIYHDEVESLNHCLNIAQRYGYPYFEANAKEALAEHDNCLELAEDALLLFQRFGDVYQIAGAYRTLASCYHAMGDDYRALENLHHALADKRINQAPDLVASIREQLSVAYAAINDKQQSDYNRNIYIDLQEQTRQDRELEARAGILDRAVGQLNLMIIAVVAAIVLLLGLLWLFNRMNRKSRKDHQLDDLLEQKNEEVAEARLRVAGNELRNLEQRAKVSLAMSILPLIERIVYTIEHLPLTIEHLPSNHSGQSSDAEMDYIRELTDTINDKNDLLTQWIQLRQGELNMHIESFALQPLFDLVSRGKASFDMKGIRLTVQPTASMVKADRVLTLFMLNTLADNARKFTPRGGSVSIHADEHADYVELSVTDTGCGMNGQQLAHVFDHTVTRGHGFGLMNCRGIIEKYRKMSRLFSVCMLSAESEEGRGSRFFFRLPKGVVRLFIVALWLLSGSLPLSAVIQQLPAGTPLDRAHIYADSAYFSNINGTYSRTLLFADSCRQCLNDYYRQQVPGGKQLLIRNGDTSVTPAEILWLRSGISTNYQILLDIRNESAVAALALHEWQLYAYNNKVYTQLFKELSADATLADYCRTMQQSQTNKRIAVILLLLLLVLIVPAYYMLYYRHRLYNRFRHEHLQQTNLEMADDELRRAELEDSKLHVANAVLDNCLSTLKHETMYYPNRIRQLVDSGNTGDIATLAEVARYYRELYGILIQQATSQVERIHLRLHPVNLYGTTVMGDENLLNHLFTLLNPQEVSTRADDGDVRYVTFRVKPAAPLSAIHSLLCRQIVRDHGEATLRRGCGITTDNEVINVILPRYNGKV
jgi:signal transduction histidine kinase